MSIVLDGSNLSTTGVINYGTAVASTSGTSIDFTGIPAGTKRITVMFNAVSLSGSSLLRVQVGSGSFSTTNYSGSFVSVTSGQSSGGVATTNQGGFDVYIYSASSSYQYTGFITLALVGSNVWAATGNVGTNSAASIGIIAAVSPTLSGALDRVRITTQNGTDTFDNGSINIMYE